TRSPRDWSSDVCSSDLGPSGTIGTQFAVRSLDQLDARLLTGITGIRSPFISPDGHWIGFFEGNTGELKKVSILGGPPITLCKYKIGRASCRERRKVAVE